MSSDHISYIALLISIVSLIVSFITLYLDKHNVNVKVVPFENPKDIYNLSITVSNNGKRPISINHVLLIEKGKTIHSCNFAKPKKNKIDVGESRNCKINANEILFKWVNLEEIRNLDIYVIDAIGKKHKAIWES